MKHNAYIIVAENLSHILDKKMKFPERKFHEMFPYEEVQMPIQKEVSKNIGPNKHSNL